MIAVCGRAVVTASGQLAYPKPESQDSGKQQSGTAAGGDAPQGVGATLR
jgi:hypothetical protein